MKDAKFKKGHIPWNKGKKNWMSKEAKERMIAKKKDKPAWNKGKKCPYVSEWNKLHPTGKGEKNPNWKGGLLAHQKKQALIRDDYTCQICGLRDKEIMEVDHIIPQCVAPELKFELNNLMTLCPNCHRRKSIREKKQGYTHNE